MDEFFIRRDNIEGNIPALCLQLFNFLTVVGEANEQGPFHSAVIESGESAVIKAAAHAHAIAGAIKSHQRQ